MDVEIVKKNGRKFRLSDYGVVKDFVVDSIDQEVVRDSVEGRPGSLEYGVYDGDRSISVPFILKAKDLHDYAHLRDELYSLLGDREPFYIREMRRPKTLQYDFVSFGQSPKWSSQTDNEYVNGKQYLVRLDRSMSPSQKGIRGEVTLEFVTSGLPYAESAYTTLELHDSGYSATAEKYGLVDNINVEKVKYRFETGVDVISFADPNAWEKGSINSTTGALSDVAGNIRTKNFTNIIPGKEYTIKETLDTPNLRQWWVMEYDNDDSFVGWVATPFSGPLETTFVARGTKMKMRASMIGENSLNPSDVGVITIPELTSKVSVNTFNVYNAGNVTIEPESMYLNIGMRYVTTSGGFTIRNETTGEEHVINSAHERRHLRLNGMVATSGNLNNFRNTNRRFISLVPGDNRFTVSGGTFEEIGIDFKYLYK